VVEEAMCQRRKKSKVGRKDVGAALGRKLARSEGGREGGMEGGEGGRERFNGKAFRLLEAMVL